MPKFKINFENIHDSLLREIEGKTVIVLDIPSLTGRKRFYLEDGAEIEAVDIVMEMALTSYECPKIPITRLSKEDKIANEKLLAKKNKKKKELTEASAMFYNASDFSGRKPFSKVE